MNEVGETCGKTFEWESALKEHVEQVHLKMRDFECDTCKKKFGTNPAIQMSPLSPAPEKGL
jgi:transposase